MEHETVPPAPRDAPDPRLRTGQVVDAAADLAHYLLHRRPERLRHSEAVARRAEVFTIAVSDVDAPLLVAAAWLHDIGYADELHHTGFHPVDGALHLQSTSWPPQICALVAHHSGARFVAAARELTSALQPFPYSEDPISDALTVADQTAGPDGRPMTVPERITDMLDRHGFDSPNARAHAERGPYLLATATRVADRLQHRGINPTPHRIL